MNVPGWIYDLFMWPLDRAGLGAARKRLMHGLRGRVLEIGAGTGLNLKAAPATAQPTIALDRDLGFLQRARQRSPKVVAVCASAEALPFRDGVFDAAVESLAFCSIDRPEAALSEIRRVVRRGGELRMLDHVHAPGRLLGRAQERLAPAWLRVTGGCHLDRDLAAQLKAAGLVIERRVQRLRGAIEEIVVRL